MARAEKPAGARYSPDIKAAGTMMYIGPSWPVKGLKQDRAYIGGYPKIMRLEQEHPWFDALFVSANEYLAAKRDLNDKGSIKYTLYQRALALMKGENV